MDSVPKLLVFSGIVLIGVGVLWSFSSKLGWFGKLPGDIHITRENFSFHFPLVTCLMISLLLTLLFNFFGKR